MSHHGNDGLVSLGKMTVKIREAHLNLRSCQASLPRVSYNEYPQLGKDLRNYPGCRLRSEDDDLIPLTLLSRSSALYFLSVYYPHEVSKMTAKPESSLHWTRRSIDSRTPLERFRILPMLVAPQEMIDHRFRDAATPDTKKG